MNVEEWYKRAFVITKGDPLYKDFVHDVYIKIQRKREPFNDSYIYLAIYNRWLDEKRRKKEETLNHSPSFTQYRGIEYDDYGLDDFEIELVKALSEGYKLKEIAKICGAGDQFIYSVYRSIKAKVNDSK